MFPGDVLRNRHLVALVILEYNAYLRTQFFKIIFTEVYAIQQNASFYRVVEAG